MYFEVSTNIGKSCRNRPNQMHFKQSQVINVNTYLAE